MKILSVAAAIIVALLTPVGARAEEKPIILKDTPGRAVVETNCGSCHSLDYIAMNSPFLDAKQWEAEVAKMIGAFGAPVEAGDGKAIAEYLAKNYAK
jgi:mono/diheme cytochrome c family protein